MTKEELEAWRDRVADDLANNEAALTAFICCWTANSYREVFFAIVEVLDPIRRQPEHPPHIDAVFNCFMKNPTGGYWDRGKVLRMIFPERWEETKRHAPSSEVDEYMHKAVDLAIDRVNKKHREALTTVPAEPTPTSQRKEGAGPLPVAEDRG